jgi:hypothetical protein
MDFDERFLRDLAYYNADNKKLLEQVRRVYKQIMQLRLMLAPYDESIECK